MGQPEPASPGELAGVLSSVFERHNIGQKLDALYRLYTELDKKVESLMAQQDVINAATAALNAAAVRIGQLMAQGTAPAPAVDTAGLEAALNTLSAVLLPTVQAPAAAAQPVPAAAPAPPAPVAPPAPAAALTVATTALPDGAVGVPYAASVTASGGTPPYQFSTDPGHLPPGLQLTGGGLLAGTPGAAGTGTFEARVTDGLGAQAALVLAITVAPAAAPAAG